MGFLNILECCRYNNVKGLVYASSSSVYGGNKKIPFSESDNVDCPISIYAASKKSNELMAYTYNHLFGLNVTGLRFYCIWTLGKARHGSLYFYKKIIKTTNLYMF